VGGAALCGACAWMLAACGSGGENAGPAPKAVTVRDFAPARGEGATAAARAERPPGAVVDVNGVTEPRAVEITGPIGASGGVTNVTATPGAPGASAGGAGAVGPSVLVDAKIGEVNGKPIYASAFFDVGSLNAEPIGTTLEQMAARMPKERWAQEAGRAVQQRLGEIIRDELLRAEAMANLPQEKQQGLFAYLQDLQEEARRQAGGSREALRRNLESEGMTPEEFARRNEQITLIRYELSQKIDRRINVTSRDVAQAYQGRYYEQYHAPPKYVFRLVQVPASATDDRSVVERALADGTPFAQIATLAANRFARDDDPAKAGRAEREVKDEAAKGELFPDPKLNAAAAGLTVGQTTGPVEIGASLFWVHLESVVVPPDLYSAQLAIEDQLRNERSLEARARYVERLQGRASVTSIPEMYDRLMRIAAERYMPSLLERK
jgi:hypothetical protein